MSRDCNVTYWDFLEPIWDDQELSDDPELFLKWFRGISEVQQVLFPTHWLIAEVCNGGFHQYFSNSTGIHAPEAITAFRKLGLSDMAEITEKAVSVFGEPFPRDRDIRNKFLDSIEESEQDPFDQLDDSFYEVLKIPGAPDFYEDDRFTVAANKYVQLIQAR